MLGVLVCKASTRCGCGVEIKCSLCFCANREHAWSRAANECCGYEFAVVRTPEIQFFEVLRQEHPCFESSDAEAASNFLAAIEKSLVGEGA